MCSGIKGAIVEPMEVVDVEPRPGRNGARSIEGVWPSISSLITVAVPGERYSPLRK